jgi:hypothetical protein
VDIPLELRNPYGLAMLAGIITSTPGTLWVAFDEASGVLTIHVFDLVDEAEWVRTIKGRYERLLLEMLACADSCSGAFSARSRCSALRSPVRRFGFCGVRGHRTACSVSTVFM